MTRVLAGIRRQDVEAAIRTSLAVGVPLLALEAVGRLDLAIYASFGALASLYGNGEPWRLRLQTQIVAGIGLLATIAAGVASSAAQGPTWLLGVLLAAIVLATGTLGATMRWIPRGDFFFVLVLMVLAAIPANWDRLPLALVVGAGSVALSVLLAALTGRDTRDARLGSVRLRRRLTEGYAALDGPQHIVLIVAAMLGTVASWLLALALGVGHPFWAPLAVAAVIPALASPDVWRRTLHLVLGTLAGVAFSAILFSFDPGHLALIAIIVACQAAAELVVARNFGVALLFLSPLAIGMSNISRGLPWQPLLVDRLTEAAIGAAVAFGAIFLGRSLLKSGPAKP
ncbi:MAG: hypothetical protein GEV13_05365 [Rhodospirillales bacterium]|nr:hypothetical protein [Rhodospirillales bacterium]